MCSVLNLTREILPKISRIPQKNIDAVNRKLVDNMTNVNVTNDILNTNIFRQHQVNDRFSGAMGHGHAGELMGDTMDKLKLKKNIDGW